MEQSNKGANPGDGYARLVELVGRAGPMLDFAPGVVRELVVAQLEWMGCMVAAHARLADAHQRLAEQLAGEVSSRRGCLRATGSQVDDAHEKVDDVSRREAETRALVEHLSVSLAGLRVEVSAEFKRLGADLGADIARMRASGETLPERIAALQARAGAAATHIDTLRHRLDELDERVDTLMGANHG